MSSFAYPFSFSRMRRLDYRYFPLEEIYTCKNISCPSREGGVVSSPPTDSKCIFRKPTCCHWPESSRNSAAFVDREPMDRYASLLRVLVIRVVCNSSRERSFVNRLACLITVRTITWKRSDASSDVQEGADTRPRMRRAKQSVWASRLSHSYCCFSLMWYGTNIFHFNFHHEAAGATEMSRIEAQMWYSFKEIIYRMYAQDVNQVVVGEETPVGSPRCHSYVKKTYSKLILTVCWQHPRGSY